MLARSCGPLSWPAVCPESYSTELRQTNVWTRKLVALKLFCDSRWRRTLMIRHESIAISRLKGSLSSCNSAHARDNCKSMTRLRKCAFPTAGTNKYFDMHNRRYNTPSLHLSRIDLFDVEATIQFEIQYAFRRSPSILHQQLLDYFECRLDFPKFISRNGVGGRRRRGRWINTRELN